jgi:hypothetical protein
MTHVRTICVVVLVAAWTAACSSSDGNVPSNPSAPTSSNPGPTTNLEAELTFCVNETNRYRATQGLSAVARSSALDAYAAAGAQLNRTGFVGGLIPREDHAHGPTKQVLPGAT